MSKPDAWETPSDLVLAGNQAQCEWDVLEAALTWDAMFPARSETMPEDDELYFAVRRMVAARDLVSKTEK